MSVCDINLIATRRRQKQRAIALMRCSVYSLIALTVGVALVYAWMSMAMRLTAGRIAEVEARLNDPSLADAIARIEFLETNIATLEPRVDLLEKVHGSETAWIEVLRDVGSSIPQGVWISQLVSHRQQDQHTISIRGSASRQGDMQGDIGEFMLRLDEPEWSGVPMLGYTQANMSSGGHAVADFEVTVPLTRVIGSDIR
jgi:Tfp pilus assembly protein PilN